MHCTASNTPNKTLQRLSLLMFVSLKCVHRARHKMDTNHRTIRAHFATTTPCAQQTANNTMFSGWSQSRTPNTYNQPQLQQKKKNIPKRAIKYKTFVFYIFFVGFVTRVMRWDRRSAGIYIRTFGMSAHGPWLSIYALACTRHDHCVEAFCYSYWFLSGRLLGLDT